MAKTAAQSPTIDLVAALKAASPEDLASIDERITECERELADLREVRRVLDRRLNGPQKRTSPARAKGGSELAERIYDLLTERGKGTSRDVGEWLGLTAQQVGVVMAKSGWFRKLDSGYWTIAKTQDAT